MTYKQQFNRKYGFKLNEPHSIDDIAKITKIKKSILLEVRNRGVGAWKNNPSSVRNIKGVKGGSGRKMSKEAWYYGRIYSFVMGGKTQKTADADLWSKHLKSKKK